MEKKILITGANGIIGKELINQLEKQGICFRIALRNITKTDQLANSNCPIVLLDYNKPQTYCSALEGISDLFLATPASHPDLEELLVPVLDYAKQMGVKHVVSLGAIGVDQNGESPLSVAEKCIQGSGLGYTILRPNFIMQNFLPFIPLIMAKKGKMELPAGYSKVSLVDAEDIAAAVAQSLVNNKHTNKTYTLTGNQSIDFFEIAHIMSKITLKTITYIPISHNHAKKEMQQAGWPQERIKVLIALFEIIQQGWCEQIKGDLSSILEREPNTLENFIWKYRDYWNQK